MTTRRSSTSSGSAVTWTKTGEEPLLLQPGTVEVGNVYCYGCQHYAPDVPRAAFDTHVSNCNR